MSIKHNFNFFEQIYDILMILVDLCGKFPWLIFCYPDPFHGTNPADLNEDSQLWFKGPKYNCSAPLLPIYNIITLSCFFLKTVVNNNLNKTISKYH